LRGLLIGKGGLTGNTLRMAPPLTLTETEAKEGLAILADAISTVNTAVITAADGAAGAKESAL
jgi:4-aminobutyrate aminotransferase-like enzyme